MTDAIRKVLNNAGVPLVVQNRELNRLKHIINVSNGHKKKTRRAGRRVQLARLHNNYTANKEFDPSVFGDSTEAGPIEQPSTSSIPQSVTVEPKLKYKYLSDKILQLKRSIPVPKRIKPPEAPKVNIKEKLATLGLVPPPRVPTKPTIMSVQTLPPSRHVRIVKNPVVEKAVLNISIYKVVE